jgi:hypothetical protein
MDGIATVVNVLSWKKICILKSQRTLREKYAPKKIKKTRRVFILMRPKGENVKIES